MKLYERSLKNQFVGLCIASFLNVLQLALSIIDARPVGFAVFFSIGLGVFMVLTIVVSVDLAQNDPEIVSAQVEFIEEYRIHIRKPNGKIVKVRVKAEEYNQFYVNQPLQLVFAKRTDGLLAIHSVDKLEEDNDGNRVV